MIEAAIDIGTNTMLILVADVDEHPARRIVKVLDDRINFVRLGQGVHRNRAFAPEAMERSLKCFREYRRICDSHSAKKIHAVATSASRDSSNAREFYDQVERETGIRVRIIDGDAEARLSFLGGLLPSQDPGRSVILDIGGGSTEFVTLRNGRTHGQSVDVGSVRATEMFLHGDPYLPDAVKAMEEHLLKLWDGLDRELQGELRAKEWTGIAGTPTTLAGMDLGMTAFDAAGLDGYRMTLEKIRTWRERLAGQTQAARAAHPLMGTGRADIMVAGVAILLTAMDYFGKDCVVVSSRGLRHGVLLDPEFDRSG